MFDIASNLSDTTARLSKYVFGSGDSDVAQVISSARLQAEELYQKLSLLDGSLPVERPGIIFQLAMVTHTKIPRQKSHH